MKKLKEFWIIGLWGERNYHLIMDDGKLIMVGENGCGKSTVLRIFFYTLAQKWGRLLKEDFNKIKIVFEDKVIEFSKEQLGRSEEYYLDPKSDVFDHLPMRIRRRIFGEDMHKIMSDDVKDLLYNMGLSDRMFQNELEELEKLTTVVPSSMKEISDYLNNYFDYPILYMPTYRRIEKRPEISEGYYGYDQKRTKWDKRNISNLKIEVSHIGMSDVNDAIHSLIREIKRRYSASAAQLNVECFKGILSQDFKEVTSIPIEFLEPESIEMVFESMNEQELSEAEKILIKEKLMAIIEKTESYDEYDKIVIYYYNMLINRYEKLKQIEEKLEHFFYVCNQYLSGKEFVYKPNNFEYSIEVKSRDGSKKEMSIEQLSSGEKQIVAMFSYIYLLIKDSCMVIIDEPELSLSVPWQEIVLEDVLKSDTCSYLVVATQSPFVYQNTLRPYTHAIEEFLTVE